MLPIRGRGCAAYQGAGGGQDVPIVPVVLHPHGTIIALAYGRPIMLDSFTQPCARPHVHCPHTRYLL